MNYRQNNTKRNIVRGVLVLGLISAPIFYFWGTEIHYGVSQAAHYVSKPLWKAGNRITNTASSYGALVGSKESLQQKNYALEKEIIELRLKLLSKDLLLQENKELKAVLGRLGEKKAVLAAVLSRPNSSPYDTLIIDIGKDKGIQKGDKVLVAGEVVFGIIQEVYAESSKVELYSSPGLVQNVLLGEGAISTTAKGKGAGNFEITLPRDVGVSLDDVVTIPDIEMTILGTVLYIEKDPNSPFQTILVKSPVNLSELRVVEVVVASSSEYAN